MESLPQPPSTADSFAVVSGTDGKPSVWKSVAQLNFHSVIFSPRLCAEECATIRSL
jgi:hypothetical protein